MSRIIVALDGMDQHAMWNLASKLNGLVWGFKANDAILESGVKDLEWLTSFGKLFLDPKLLDIPNTVKNQVRRMVNSGADLITVHASGGQEMMTAAVQEGGNRILGVTVLTSMSDTEVGFVYSDLRSNVVGRLAHSAHKAGCWGVVCAPGDLAWVPQGCNTVVPGFRPHGLVKGDDQKNIGGGDDVKLATLVVVGRPITQAEDPVKAAVSINELLKKDEAA